jgi:hypothetical protein
VLYEAQGVTAALLLEVALQADAAALLNRHIDDALKPYPPTRHS